MPRQGSPVRVLWITIVVWICVALLLIGSGCVQSPALHVAEARQPATAPAAPRGLADPAKLPEIDRAIDEAIARGDVPGAVLVIGRSDGMLYRKAYGNRAVRPEAVPMTVDTVFDLASLTKPIACATSVMLLVERGKLKLDEPVGTYLPAFANNGKEPITVAQLLLHHSGLIADNHLRDYGDGPAKAIERVNALRPTTQPGTKFIYSDVGYIVLAELVKKVDGRALDVFAREELFRPLGMNDAGYMPPDALRMRSAPTENREGRWMVGEVHDPRAYALGGVAGHAGLFATGDDVARWCRMILRRGELDGRRVLADATVRDMTTPRPLPDKSGNRGYGFDIDTGFSPAPRGERFSRGTTFGHTGFTGTMLWIDPENDAFVVLLTNAVHPEGKGKATPLRRRVSTLAAEALLGPRKIEDAVAQEPVRCGIDVLAADQFKPLANQRIAIITNQTGLDRDGGRTIDVLRTAPGVKVVKLFSPEHGLWGLLDEKVSDSVDPQTGLKVYSLYGKTRKPTAEMLEGVDTVVFDIQDAGTRFYTYVSTMGLCMEACAEHKVTMVVLDRPNPITGLRPDGPIADEKDLGFTAYAPIPVVHGMTVGELARMFNKERGIGCELTVVPMRGWRRDMWFDQTGRMWVNPSPNLRNPTQAVVYPAIGLLEFTNLSVGRGTDQPFEQFGAPWIDARKLAAALNAASLPGLRFTPTTFTPVSSKFNGELCQGVYIAVTDRHAIEPARTGLTIAWHLRALHGEKFEIDKVNTLLKNAAVMKALRETKEPATLSAMWKETLAAFIEIREKYLMYP